MKVKKTYREQMIANDAALDYYAAMFGKETPALWKNNVAAKREYKKSGNVTETEIVRAILKCLKSHPKVAMAWRVNSGAVHAEGRYVRFNTQRGMADIMGTLKDGRTIACEAKSATGRIQPHQQQFLDSINAAGGVAFVARSVGDVLAALNAI